MKKIVMLLIIAGALGAAQPAEYLVRIDGRSAGGLKVIELIDGQALALVEEEGLDRLKASAVPFAVIDTNPSGKLYLLVFPAEGRAADLRPYGSVLSAFDECVLLRTTGDRIPDLNRLPVELARLNLRALENAAAGALDFNRAPLAPDTLIQEMVARVDPDSVFNAVLRLQRFYTRYSTYDSNQAAVDWIRDKLTAYGCDSVFEQSFSQTYKPNVVGIERGKLYPSVKRYCLIGGHLDDGPSPGPAPGADDNASGTVAMLEACRVMRDFNFENTIRFCGFNAEEQGLIGSDSLAARARALGDTILAATCYDMIGYVSAPDSDIMRLRYTTAVPGCSLFACGFYQAVADTYTLLKIRPVRYTGTVGSSDHASFWRQGYVSSGGIERALCPGYHTPADSIGPEGFNNIGFAVHVIQTAVAVLAKLAVPIHSGSVVDDPGGGVGPPLFCVQPEPGRSFLIRFQVRSAADEVELAVYDASGRLVRRLVRGELKKGIHSIAWDGRDGRGCESVPGVYFAAWTCAGRERVKKITLVR